MSLTEMTLSEAAETLGVSKGATREEVNKAARRLIAKYHPDAWRNKSESEQKAAEEKFIRVNAAKKIMLDPTLAASDDDETSYSQQDTQQQTYYKPERNQNEPQDNGYSSHVRNVGTGRYSYTSASASNGNGRDAWKPTRRVQTSNGRNRPAQTNHVSDPRGSYASDINVKGREERKKYNTSTSFKDLFGQSPDVVELQIAKEISKNLSKRYKQTADVIRVTPSMASSAALIACALISITTSFTLNFVITSGMNKIMPLIAILVFGIAKMLTYDMLISFYVHHALSDKLSSWTISGIEGTLLGAAGLVISILCEASIAAYVAMVLTFLIVTIVSLIVTSASNKKNDR